MSTPAIIRDYQPEDQHAVDAVVRAAWQELAALMPGWSGLASRLGALTEKAAESEVIVAEIDERVVGAVGYVGPHRPKPDFFNPGWPIVRLLSVDPSARGRGLGGQLLEECIARARRDGASCLALHTTTLMAAAQGLYKNSGFELLRQLPDMYGAPYVLMTKKLQTP
jgi:ribosomal protein S18 acetylase RimI-like enzyme